RCLGPNPGNAISPVRIHSGSDPPLLTAPQPEARLSTCSFSRLPPSHDEDHRSLARLAAGHPQPDPHLHPPHFRPTRLHPMEPTATVRLSSATYSHPDDPKGSLQTSAAKRPLHSLPRNPIQRPLRSRPLRHLSPYHPSGHPSLGP